jgi:hypothetical protein
MRTFAQKQNQPQKQVSSSFARPNTTILGPNHRADLILHLQRACACGNHAMAGGECSECSKKNRLGLQTKLKVNELSFIWNDIIDPNGAYISDKIKSALAYAFTSSPWHHPENYRISIGWHNTCSVWLPTSGGQQVTGGYPELLA